MLKATLGNNEKQIKGALGNKNSGLSAYEVWLLQGNTGTEADFLASLKGEKGEKGEPGEKGAPFTYDDFTQEQLDQFKGIKGDTGPQGPKGEAFTYNDFTVEQLEALKGETGPQGPAGEKGEKGEPGEAGNDGLPGADGKDGAKGADGKSAYEIWLSVGNTGSEADFLASLKGADGKDGKDGADGKDGKDANPAQINFIVSKLEALEADVQFKTIEIKNLKTNVGTVEKGTVMPEVKVSWQTNIPATEVMLNRMCGGSGTVHQWLGNVTEYVDEVKNIDTTTTYYLTVKDKRGNTYSDKVSAVFCNGLYYGVVTAGAQINDALMETLTKKLQTTRGITFTETAGENQHIAFALPVAYGEPVFMDADQNIGAGFYMAGQFLHTNSSGWQEDYQLWLSTYTDIGKLKVKVS